MKSGKSGKTTKKSGSGFNWAKIVIVMVCVAFAGIMIVTSLGSSWLVAMKPAQSGDVAYVDITMKDELGRTVFTTNQGIFNATLQKGTVVWLAAPMGIPVNGTSSNLIDPVPGFLPGQGQMSFAFFGPEYNQIAQGLVGMREGETRTITFVKEPTFQQDLNPEQFSEIGGNFTEAMKGDQLILGFTTSPMIGSGDNTSPQYALRTVPIIEKTNDTIAVYYGYSSADVTILRLTRNS
jgi:hypothetical protein